MIRYKKIIGKPFLSMTQVVYNKLRSDKDSHNEKTQYLPLKFNSVSLRSKLFVLIGLVFLSVNLIFSSLFIFSIDHFNEFISSSQKLDQYLDLHKAFFKTNEFLAQFKSFDTNFNSYNDYLEKILKWKEVE